MSKIPAWKRLGLQVKEDVEEGPLTTTTHLEHDNVTNKIAKKLNRKRQLQETKTDTNKKPPKRVKVSKADRKPPPEKDQLAYLRQYSEDKDNWKFSKQKQNWLLKNIELIPLNYEAALITYVEGIQGGARDRLVEQLKEIVSKWNAVAQAVEDKVNIQLYGTVEEKEKLSAETENASKEENAGPEREYTIRCKKLLDAIQDDEIILKGVELEEEAKEESTETEKEETLQERDIQAEEFTGAKTQDETEAKEQDETETKEQNETEAKEQNETEAVPEDNLVIDEIEVEEYQFSSDKDAEVAANDKQEEKEEKKSKKEKKKSKKMKSEKKNKHKD